LAIFTLKSVLRNPETAGAPEAGTGSATWLRHYFNTKDTKDTKDTKRGKPSPSRQTFFVQLHTN